jgi:hypothetical protein
LIVRDLKDEPVVWHGVYERGPIAYLELRERPAQIRPHGGDAYPEFARNLFIGVSVCNEKDNRTLPRA